ncbi:MAG: TetR/AcrR family transcriptional regulator [Acidimicrobiia bacterium]|nr:MAG: TetR/AcrR family transcriptional regulator [Acidimicrobiia bacterium]
MTRLTRDDIVAGAGRRFAAYGYHGTSMRDLGDDLGILGSSIYAHVGGKQELFVAVVDRGAAFFAESAEQAAALGSDPLETLRLLISGHIDVVLDHRSEARTYLAEAPFLDETERTKVIAARNAYEDQFARTIAAYFDADLVDGSSDARLTAIYVLSILNAIDRWYDEGGRLSREELASHMFSFVCDGLLSSR